MQRTKLCLLALLALAALTGGCARNEVVKSQEETVPTTARRSPETGKEKALRPQDSKAASTADSNTIMPSRTSTADSQKKTSALQSTPAAVYFGYDSYILTADSRDVLQTNFKTLAGKPSIQIEGHCDERGSSEYNLALGEKRAKSAQNYLVTMGYPAEKISTISYGKERPADKGSDESAWAKNRRDEFRIVK
ncbi:MAG: peptidoglycan-associated lipoprotein Pal [Deltaproteobacteria bacterium]|nr:peptidoglycan-associated lipoprotein Pal [Deltaproteobacteria bacterium]